MSDGIQTFISAVVHALTFPLPFVLWPVPYAIPFWLVYAWSRAGERKVLVRSLDTSELQHDRGSWQVIDYGSKAAKVAAVMAAFLTQPWMEGSARLWLYAAGLLLMFMGAALRRHCFRKLGEYFTFHVSVSDKQQIVQHGIYKWVRHPSYTGGMLFNIGIGLALTNWISVLFLGLGMALFYVYRVRTEEKALLRQHGANYGDYMLRTKRFVPFIF